jgi:superfamily II RNA helicase
MLQETIESLTGFPLDIYQKKSLEFITAGDDVLVMLPTGSGKSLIAFEGVMKAFLEGHRVIYTSPIKALSNQKFSEFSNLLSKAGFPNRVSLITGDIQSRCYNSNNSNSNSENNENKSELLIMTSEILANKLEKINDPDLANVSVLVIDEAHYITDQDRGHVWERTIMNLPPSVQIVALSATMNEPEKFQEWLNLRRKTQLVLRKDRHVPLHFGFYSKETFIELYNTSSPQKSISSLSYAKLKPQTGTFSQGMNKLVTLLQRENRLPAIVFVLSRAKCEEAARSIRQNLLYGPRPVMGKDDDPLAFGEIESEHSFTVKTIRNRQDELYRKYLQPYHTILSSLSGFEEWKEMINRGVAYHHSGLIPMLREYIEILFSERLLSLVFATESLAIGINMPTKCVVFTNLEKPSGYNGEMVPLRPDQFMQMAGRSGRRGIDEKGYVVYFPLKESISETDFRNLLFGKMPTTVSQLSISPLFVLKSIALDGRANCIERSLLFHQQEKYNQSLIDRLSHLPEIDEDTRKKGQRVIDIQERLKPSMFKISQGDKKSLEKELKGLMNEIGEEKMKLIVEREKLEEELENGRQRFTRDWEISIQYLRQHLFLNEDNEDTLTIKGKVTSGLSDGCPLTRGVMITDSFIEIEKTSFTEIAGWLGYFTEVIRLEREDYHNEYQNPLVNQIESVMASLDIASLSLDTENDKVSYEMSAMIYLWARDKDIAQISYYISFGNLGTFIRAVMRVISYMEEMKGILLGLEMYELYNLLENHSSRLMDGIVTNRSLYVG